MGWKTLAVFLVIFGVVAQSADEDVYISNADNQSCLRCLCMAASECNLKAGCSGPFCGPFHMSFPYYLDAVENTSMQKTEEAFKECSQDYKCAERVVKYYLVKFAKDCNNDGVTDCTDYAMIHFNGGNDCSKSLFRNSQGSVYGGRYLNCTGY